MIGDQGGAVARRKNDKFFLPLRTCQIVSCGLPANRTAQAALIFPKAKGHLRAKKKQMIEKREGRQNRGLGEKGRPI